MIARPLNRPFFALVAAAAVAWAASVGQAAEDAPPPGENVHLRGSFANSRIQLQRSKKAHVAFIGGSITEMNGYRPMVCEMLKRRFPQTAFTLTDAGIASTCSTTGAFRLASDVLGKGPVDLLFIEFAVNDDQDAHHARRECIRGMEGMLRQALRHNPHVDIVITYFVNPGMVQTLQKGKTPLPIAAHETVAEHYAVSTVDLAREVAGRIAAGKLTWKEFGGTHPAPRGNALCAGMIEAMLDRAWSGELPAGAVKVAHKVPEPLDELSYAAGRFVDPGQANVQSGWTLGVPDWSKLPGSKRGRFTKIPMLWADRPGAELTLEFEGTAVGAYVVAGPDAGIVEASVDNGPAGEVNLLHRFSAGLHYPRTVMFATDLKPGRHRRAQRNTVNSAGTGLAARIVQFVANY